MFQIVNNYKSLKILKESHEINVKKNFGYIKE